MEKFDKVAPVEDFNWDAYENGEATTNVSHEDLEKAYDNTLSKVNDREVVDGTVIAMNKREVVVNIGYKSDGIIPMSEFRTSKTRRTRKDSWFCRTAKPVQPVLGTASTLLWKIRKSSRVTSSAAQRVV